jgi:probable HAF family extracellular repeat protein
MTPVKLLALRLSLMTLLRHAFLYSHGVMTDLDTRSYAFSIAWAINDAGQVVGDSDSSDGNLHAFLYSNGTMTDLGTLRSFSESGAFAINDTGQIIGYSRHYNSGGGVTDRPFLYSNGVMTDLNDLLPPGSGWTLNHVLDINDLGQIVGDGLNPSGQTPAFLMTPERPAIQLVLAAPSIVTAGSPFDITVTALDDTGQVATGYTGTVSFTSSDPYTGVLPPEYTFTAADNGTHTFTGVSHFAAGTQTLTAQDTANSSLNASATVGVTAAAADHFLIMAPSTALSGIPFDVAVTALDPYSNVDTNYTGTVTWSSSDTNPGVLLPADYTFQPADNGSHTFTAQVTLITPGDQALTATDMLSGTTGTAAISVIPGPPGGAARSPWMPSPGADACRALEMPLDRIFASLGEDEALALLLVQRRAGPADVPGFRVMI